MRDVILEKIESFLESGRIFTAYEITKELRAEGVFVRHSEVKEALSEVDLGLSGYDKTLATSTVFNPQPFIYYPDNRAFTDAVLKYELKLISELVAGGDVNIGPAAVTTPVTPVVTPNVLTTTTPCPYTGMPPKQAPVAPVVDTKVDDADDFDLIPNNPDARGRFTVPNRYVKALFNIGDYVEVTYNEDEDFTSIAKFTTGVCDTVLRVDKSGNIRVNSIHLPDSDSLAIGLGDNGDLLLIGE